MSPKALFCIVGLVVLAATLVTASHSVIDEELIQAVNSNPHSTWVAASNDRFSGMSLEEARRMFQRLPDLTTSPMDTKSDIAPRALPPHFDSRSQWFGCIGESADQGSCSAGWAIASTGVLSDRLCIFTGGKVKVRLSAENILSCDNQDSGCEGGFQSLAWQFLILNGVVSEGCSPYVSQKGEVPSCRAECVNAGESNRKYRALASFQLYGEETVRGEIYKNGPVEARMAVYSDLLHYKAGIYQQTNGTFLGDHAVKLVGWGEENGVKFWIAQNSWGTSWGNMGFFKILRDENEVGIEDDVLAAMPEVPQDLAPKRTHLKGKRLATNHH